MDDVQDEQLDSQNARETPAGNVFIPPSIDKARVLSGDSYTHRSAMPSTISVELSTECVLGVDEAGRGPVLGKSHVDSGSNISLIASRTNGVRFVLLTDIDASFVTG